MAAAREFDCWDCRNGPAAWDAPLRWLRGSRENFQWLMHLLAARSARLSYPRDAPWTGPPPPREPEPDWSAAPPPRHESQPAPETPGGMERDEPRRTERPAEWPPRRIGGPERNRTRIGEREGDQPATCRRAGRVVEGAGWYVVAPGDTLQQIAVAHYGSDRAWRRILHANWHRIPDPDVIYACQRLFIPRWPSDWPSGWPPGEARWPPRDEEREPEAEPAAHRRPSGPVDRGPDGCSRCGAGTHGAVWEGR